MKQFQTTTLFALLALCLSPLAVSSFELTGRVSGDFYAYQRGTEDHARPYLRFRGNAVAWRSPEGRFLRFHTSMRLANDFVTPLPTDPDLFIYDACLQLHNVVPWTSLYAGRQFVYTGVGSSLIDGVRFSIRPLEYVTLDAFGGNSVSSETPEKIRSIGDHLVAGGRLGVEARPSTRLGLNWMLTRRDGMASFHRIGLDADQLFDRAEFYGRGAFNALDLRLAEILARAIYRYENWYLSGEYHVREPSVAHNSLFALIDFYPYEILRAETRRRVWRQLSFAVHIHADIANQDDIPWRIGFGIHAPSYSLFWIHQDGYAGENDGLSGHFTRTLTTVWSVYATANLFRYRVQLEQMERSDSYASTVGLRWRPGRGFTVAVEGQYMRNAVYKDDGRFLLRIAKDFSVNTKRGRQK